MRGANAGEVYEINSEDNWARKRGQGWLGVVMVTGDSDTRFVDSVSPPRLHLIRSPQGLGLNNNQKKEIP